MAAKSWPPRFARHVPIFVALLRCNRMKYKELRLAVRLLRGVATTTFVGGVRRARSRVSGEDGRGGQFDFEAELGPALWGSRDRELPAPRHDEFAAEPEPQPGAREVVPDRRRAVQRVDPRAGVADRELDPVVARL